MTRNPNEGRPVVAAFVDRFVRTAGNLLVDRRVNTNQRSRKSGYAPVEMTKERVVPLSTVVAEQEPLFISLWAEGP
jgi:hypothetical protein